MKRIISLFFTLLMLTACAPARSVPTVNAKALENGTAELRGGRAFSDSAETLAVYSGDGRVTEAVAGNFRLSDFKDGIEGIIIDPPEISITNVYDMAKASLDSGRRVLIIYLDGFGWRTYSAALSEGVLKNMGAMDCQMANAMFPTITPVNYAAMVSGKTPDGTGVMDRSGHELSCETIFDYASGLGKSAYIVEGDAQILKFSIPQELCPDMNGNGDTDDEGIEAALAAESGGYDLLFVHLHGIDDTSHKYGPDSDELRTKIAQTDEWVGQLVSGWAGDVIITADHGQHTYDGTGNSEYAGKTGTHGDFRYEDILIPIMTEREK